MTKTTLRPLRIGSLELTDLDELSSLRDDAEHLHWLWKRRASKDGEHAWCSTCEKTRRFHRSHTRASYTCGSCGTHVHPTAQTILQGSSTPLTIWFAAVQAIRTAPPQAPPRARELERTLGVPYATARRMRQRILADVNPAKHSHPAEANEIVRERLLEAATACIAEYGYDGARVRDIAERAGLSPAAVLYHFDTRAKVLLAALEWATRRAAERREAILNDLPDAAGRLAGLISLSIPSTEIVRTELQIWNEYFTRRARGELPGADSEFASHYRRSFELVIEQGVSDNQFRTDPEQVPELIEELLALVDGLAIAILVGRPWMPVDRSVHIVSRFIRRELDVDITDRINELLLANPRP
ncbi:TetR family transcriptional regulator [Microbacterium sp. AGC62]